MKSYNLRAATARDADSIRQLINEVGINPGGLDWRRFILAVDDQGNLVGCGQIKPHGSDLLELASIAVQPAHRNQGIARSIIMHLLSISTRPIYLMCVSSMGGLYEKFGFKLLENKEMPRYFQKINSLAGLTELLVRSGESLLVMKLE